MRSSGADWEARSDSHRVSPRTQPPVGPDSTSGRGSPGTSAVTAFSAYYFCMARTEATEPEDMLAPLVNSIARHEFSHGTFVVVIPPNFESLFVEQGWSKERIRDYIFEHCKRSVKDLKEDGRWGRLSSTFEGDLKENVPVEPGDEDEYVHLFRPTNPREDLVSSIRGPSTGDPTC